MTLFTIIFGTALLGIALLVLLVQAARGARARWKAEGRVAYCITRIGFALVGCAALCAFAMATMLRFAGSDDRDTRSGDVIVLDDHHRDYRLVKISRPIVQDVRIRQPVIQFPRRGEADSGKITVDRANVPAESIRSQFGRPDSVFLVFPLAALLAVLAVGIGLHVALAGSEKKMTFRDTASQLLSWLWALPVLVVLVYFGARVVPQLQDREIPDEIRLAKYDEPKVDVYPAAAESSSGEMDDDEAATDAERTDEEAARAEASSTESEGDTSTAAVLTASAAKVPGWMDETPQFQEGTESLVISSKQYSTVASAIDEIEELALMKIKEHFHRHYPYRGSWTIPPRVVDFRSNDDVFAERHIEQVERKMAGHMVDMYRAHALLKLSPQLRAELHPVWRDQIVEQRLWTLGGLVALVALSVASIAAYLRLDAATGGSYRRRLKLATVSLIVAGGLVAATTLPIG